jgi:pyrroloquinoline quinone biosynthesis protein B
VVYATEPVRRGFVDGNVLYRTLERFDGQVTWRTLEAGHEEEIAGLVVEALAVPGKPPVHLERLAPPDPGQNIGVRIREEATGRVLVYVSAAGAITGDVGRALDGADLVFFDGTFWSSDELLALGLGTKRAEDMAHLPVGGPAGSLAQLAGLRARRRVYIHVNNTNPMLREDSAERAAVAVAGWEVAWDGMEVRL